MFIAILAEKLPPTLRDRARMTGLLLASGMRLLLAGVSWLSSLILPLFHLNGHPFSARDLIMLPGGLFLLFKATMELNPRLEGKDKEQGSRVSSIMTRRHDIKHIDLAESAENIMAQLDADQHTRLVISENSDDHTLAGLLMEHLQHIPREGEEIAVGDYLCRTLQVASHRVQQVQMIPLTLQAAL